MATPTLAPHLNGQLISSAILGLRKLFSEGQVTSQTPPCRWPTMTSKGTREETGMSDNQRCGYTVKMTPRPGENGGWFEGVESDRHLWNSQGVGNHVS